MEQKEFIMREGMNLFHTFTHWLWGNYFYPFYDYENPIKYIYGEYIKFGVSNVL